MIAHVWRLIKEKLSSFQENNTNYLHDEWKQNKQKKKKPQQKRQLLGNQGVLLAAIFHSILYKYVL